MNELVTRWDLLVARFHASSLPIAGLAVAQLAKTAGLDWYVARGREPLEDFLVFDGAALAKKRSFGKKKFGKLCDIVEFALGTVEGDQSQFEPAYPLTTPIDTLSEWGVPIDFPCHLIAGLPVRILHYCEEQGIKDLEGLVEEWDSRGFSGLVSQKNLGKKTVHELEEIVNALVARDRGAAAHFLPLKASGEPGLSIGVMLSSVVASLNGTDRVLLTRRVVQELTLEDSAEEFGYTRELVRLKECQLREKLMHCLDYFSEDYERMLKEWVDSNENWCRDLVVEGDPEGSQLLIADLESIFKDTPQGIAKSMEVEMRLEHLLANLEAAPELWFGGVEISGFLESEVADEHRIPFCERLGISSRLRLDHGEGRVHPARTYLLNSICSLLAMEDDPIPVTWLVELLRQTGFHPEIQREDLVARRYRWRQRSDFPDAKILWNE